MGTPTGHPGDWENARSTGISIPVFSLYFFPVALMQKISFLRCSSEPLIPPFSGGMIVNQLTKMICILENDLTGCGY